jgi:hypothetical protein
MGVQITVHVLKMHCMLAPELTASRAEKMHRGHVCASTTHSEIPKMCDGWYFDKVTQQRVEQVCALCSGVHAFIFVEVIYIVIPKQCIERLRKTSC